MEVLVPPGLDWSSSPRVQEKPSLYTQGGVGGLEKEERGDDINTGQLYVLFYSCRMVGGNDFVNDFVKISNMFLLPIPYSLYRDPDLVDYSSEFISEFQT